MKLNNFHLLLSSDLKILKGFKALMVLNNKCFFYLFEILILIFQRR